MVRHERDGASRGRCILCGRGQAHTTPRPMVNAHHVHMWLTSQTFAVNSLGIGAGKNEFQAYRAKALIEYNLLYQLGCVNAKRKSSKLRGRQRMPSRPRPSPLLPGNLSPGMAAAEELTGRLRGHRRRHHRRRHHRHGPDRTGGSSCSSCAAAGLEKQWRSSSSRSCSSRTSRCAC